MSRMLRNAVGVKPDVKSEDLKRFVGSFSIPFSVNNYLTIL